MGMFSKDNGEKAKEKNDMKMNQNESEEKNNGNDNANPEKEAEKIENNAKEKKEHPRENDDAKKRIEELEKQLNDSKDQFIRKVAEFENYKRRTENEFSNLIKTANEYLIVDLLPVLDDFERSFDHAKDKPDFDSFYKGIELIYAKFAKTLEQKGVKPIESLDKPFDVNFHEAIMVMPKKDVSPQTVIQEILKGYLLNDKVIRHTKVIVSAEAPEESEQNISIEDNQDKS
jgi:molecular chaperone GrpE